MVNMRYQQRLGALFLCINFLLIVPTFLFCSDSKSRAVFIEPVVDLFWKQLSLLGDEFEKEYYSEIPLDGAPGVDSRLRNCKYRAGQGLFNEVVTITDRNHETKEVCVGCANMLSYNKKTKKFGEPQRLGLMEDRLLFLDELDDERASCFPSPISYYDQEKFNNPCVVTLLYPWYDRSSERIYSAATRFVRSPECDKEEHYCVKIWDNDCGQVVQSFIPKTICFICTQDVSPQERVNIFVKTIKGWASEDNGIIPYVFTGSSFVKKINDQGFETEQALFLGKEINYIVRKNMKTKPACGLNCSSIVHRLALACGIPHFFKTSYQAFKNADKMLVKRGEKFENGFLIVYPGRVFVVLDRDCGEIISASSYNYNNYSGKVRMFTVEELFEGITTVQEIEDIYAAQGKLRFKQYEIGAKNYSDQFKIFDPRRLL